MQLVHARSWQSARRPLGQRWGPLNRSKRRKVGIIGRTRPTGAQRATRRLSCRTQSESVTKTVTLGTAPPPLQTDEIILEIGQKMGSDSGPEKSLRAARISSPAHSRPSISEAWNHSPLTFFSESHGGRFCRRRDELWICVTGDELPQARARGVWTGSTFKIH